MLLREHRRYLSEAPSPAVLSKQNKGAARMSEACSHSPCSLASVRGHPKHLPPKPCSTWTLLPSTTPLGRAHVTRGTKQ